MNNHKFICIIPARYDSTRFPGKPLANLGGMTVIERVYRRVENIVDKAVVATDDERIADEVRRFGGNVVMTSKAHRSGTDRCFEAFQKEGDGYDVIINVQGDEPFIESSQVEAIKHCFDVKTTDIATLVKPFTPDMGVQSLENPNSPKVVINNRSEAMYFSRSVIPYIRGVDKEEWLEKHTYYKHIGMYAYKAEVLKEITSLPQSELEKAESLEQLRWLENGYTIKVGKTDIETIGIDTPEDLKRAEEYLQRRENNDDR